MTLQPEDCGLFQMNVVFEKKLCGHLGELKNGERDTLRNSSRPFVGYSPNPTVQVHVQKSYFSSLGLLLLKKTTEFPSICKKGKQNFLQCSRILFSDFVLT